MIKGKVENQTEPFYANGYSVFVNNPNNPTGNQITLEARLGMIASNSFLTKSKADYQSAALAGTLDPNTIYLVEED